MEDGCVELKWPQPIGLGCGNEGNDEERGKKKTGEEEDDPGEEAGEGKKGKGCGGNGGGILSQATRTVEITLTRTIN